MPHTNRDNYKAKWLNALAAKGVDAYSKTDLNIAEIRSARDVVTNATLESRLQLEILREMAFAGVELQETLDEARQIGPLRAPAIKDEADEKLTKLPASVIIRRCRDLMRLASGRIGILCAHQETQEENMAKLLEAVQELSKKNSQLQSQLVETHHIGYSPTAEERHELVATAGSSRQYRRYGIVYTNIDTENFLESLGAGTANSSEPSSGDEDDDDDNEITNRSVMTTQKSRHTVKTNGSDFLNDI